MKDFDAYVRSLGLDPAALTADQQTALEAAWRATVRAGDPRPEPDPKPKAVAKPGTAEIDELVASTDADNARKGGIAALFKKYVAEAPDRVKEFEAVVRVAIAGGQSVKDTEYELLKLSYGNGPLAFSPSKPAVDDRVIEVAVARAVGVSRETVEQDYDDRTLSAADRQFRGGCGLKRLVVMCARANGYRDADEGGFTGVESTKRMLRAAFRDGATDDPFAAAASAGFGPSNYNLSGILSNVANKSIRDYFNAVEGVWRLISAVRSVSDFKEITGYALTGDLTYKRVALGGEVKHGTLGEEEYGNKADLYAIMLGIDYQHLRNDDLGAFATIFKRLGRGGALTINDIFWAAWLATAGNFWSAANGNYAAATDYAFTLDNLDNANLAWQLRTDPDGKPMGDRAKYLLTPSKWELKAKRFMRSARVSNDGGDGEENPVAGMWEPISSTYLGNANYDGYSADNYWLVKDPMDMPAIETVFLDGQEVPTVETAEPDLSRLGIMFRGMHGFGVRRQEKRGAFKFKQTADA
jgi:hypothetical protein